jgi:hypothetical protein
MKYPYMKRFLSGKAVLNTHINVKSIEDILSEQQTNQEPDEEEDKHEAVITHAARPLNVLMHCDVLRTASQRCLNTYGKPFGMWEITFLNKQKSIINNPHWIISSRKCEHFV